MVFGLQAYQEVLLWSVILSAITVFLYKYLTNQNELRNLRQEMKKYQERIKRAQKRGDVEEMNRLTSEIMKLNGRQMHLTLKPMLLSVIIFFSAISFIASAYADMSVDLPVPMPYVSWEFPFLHIVGEYNWMWWYILVFIPVNMALRKLMNVY
ncbi:hypothetical protein DRJ04_05025 [Candidatus Aerophobetes bacterium]|uniref:DUF106 domain-containing protein n=1 Tax=Aerophobetes bacterium TaxID=2030807 RepID=A0A662DFW6_UNCAE|nr:MAG: hypothetical protein DRJ04_05025 [Candidatus Aerophobetes bacterium]